MGLFMLFKLGDIEIYEHMYNWILKHTWGIQRQMTRGRQAKPSHIIIIKY